MLVKKITFIEDSDLVSIHGKYFTIVSPAEPQPVQILIADFEMNPATTAQVIRS